MRVDERSHRLTVTAEDGLVMLRCARGDLNLSLGKEPTPDEVARAAGDHWGQRVGWWS
jgi:hypothetical protein